MFAQVIWFPETASSTARHVDHLLYYLVSVTGSMGLLVACLLIYFAVKYRRRPASGPPPNAGPSLALETFWTVAPLLFFLSMFAWGATVYIEAIRPPDDALTIYVVAK